VIDEPIISTKDRVGTYDAIETAKPGEPLFGVQGGDPFGPATVLHWVGLARAAALAESDPKKEDQLLRKATEAEHVAWAMQSYQRGEAVATPDVVRPTYNELALEPSDERTMREAMIKATARIDNAVAIIADVVDVLAHFGAHPTQEARLRTLLAASKRVASQIEPRRGNERS
jgi:hypothetical protein